MRVEKDSMGEMQVPDSALYGASTRRAMLNFPASGLRFSRRFVEALAMVKRAAALTNAKLGLLDGPKAEAIAAAAAEIARGEHYDQFVVDIFQTGSGTSTNMNANEVIANRAIEIMGGVPGGKALIHPNDHVNMCQSSNDVIPSAIHIAAFLLIENTLIPALHALEVALGKKAGEFADVIKSGRTHLQDATPVTLGQEFGGYEAQARYSQERLRRCEASLRELPLGGTAVGTGLNSHPDFARLTIDLINEASGASFMEARNHFEAQGAKDALVELSGMLKTIACSLLKIANDLRWLGAGPRCGIFEIVLPEIQPGSSIMPAKVNPVICESVMMACAKVIGNDTTISVSAQHGNFELNVMMPVLAHCLLESIELLGNVSENFAHRCVTGISANKDRCLEFAEKSLAICTSLAPKLGYDKTAELAKKAYRENRTVRDLARELKLVNESELEALLNLRSMTKPGL